MVDSGIILVKYWLEVSPEEQTRRLEARIDDGRKIWKLTPMDLKSYSRWYDYSRARDDMFAATDTAVRALERRAVRRQARGPASTSFAPAEPGAVQEVHREKDQAAQAAEGGRLPRVQPSDALHRRALLKSSRPRRPTGNERMPLFNRLAAGRS